MMHYIKDLFLFAIILGLNLQLSTVLPGLEKQTFVEILGLSMIGCAFGKMFYNSMHKNDDKEK